MIVVMVVVAMIVMVMIIVVIVMMVMVLLGECRERRQAKCCAECQGDKLFHRSGLRGPFERNSDVAGAFDSTATRRIRCQRRAKTKF
jgi:hypothetical protein